MEFSLSFKLNQAIYLRNPENTDLGKKIVKKSIDLIYEIGFEQFTFKKLAQAAGTTEATVYRYFENKHRILLYILNWYWYYIDFTIEYHLKNIQQSEQRIKTILRLLTHELPISLHETDFNKLYMHHIVIAESSKVYLTKDISEINQYEVFKPYKDLCAKIASEFSAYNKKYAYPVSLSSTVIETAHNQAYFATHLPRLTDVTAKNKKNYTCEFLETLVFKVLA